MISSMSARRSSGGPKLSSTKLAVAEDRRQQVVEVVRHAAGQLADGFHLLRLPELRLERLALADIHADAEPMRRLVLVARASSRARPAIQCALPSGQSTRNSSLKSVPALFSLTEGCLHHLPIVRMDELEKALHVAGRLFRPKTKYVAPLSETT